MTKVKVTLSKNQMSLEDGVYQKPLDKETFDKIKMTEEEKIANRIPRKNTEDRNEHRGRRRMHRGDRRGDRRDIKEDRRDNRGDRRDYREDRKDYKSDRKDYREDRRD